MTAEESGVGERKAVTPSLSDYPWRLSYSTSAHAAGGQPINILHDFYIPALKRSIRYDRVAGYFRSSSLAAASQGFSAFIERQGKARMVVGADLGTELVGYAVACAGAEGIREVRLITGLHELDELMIDETVELTGADIEPLHARLERIARQELDPSRAVADIEKLNRDAGRSQLILNYLVAYSLLDGRRRLGYGQERFWSEVTALEELIAERDAIRLTKIPTDKARRLSELLFEPTLLTVGDEGYIDAPRILLLAALEAAARVADSLHAARSELKVDDVLGRLQREIVRLLRV